jgi:tRNA-dihydrouridine synthase B
MMKIGNIELSQPIALAPMEDVTDIPFRIICKRLGADLVYTEFTSSEALIRDAVKALKKIEIVEEERPVAIQIFGGVERSMKEAARVAERYSPDFLDINCGCWVKNHVLRGEGAGLLRDLLRFEQIVKATISATHLPVTVKTRLGWDEKSIVIVEVAKMLEQCGVKALTVHCRTRSQGHQGRADWEWLTKIKKAVGIPIIGNGDITTVEDVIRMLQTGCDGVMIGRGAIANPWIFQQAKHFLQTGCRLAEPDLKERVSRCAEHLKLSVQYKGVRQGVIPFRKHYAGYLSGLPHVAQLRSELVQMLDPQAIIARLYQFLEQTLDSQEKTTPSYPETLSECVASQFVIASDHRE